MNIDFEINDTFRLMDYTELLNTLFNNESSANEFVDIENRLNGNPDLSLYDIVEHLTPTRKKIVLSAIELYKRLKGKCEDKRKIYLSSDIHRIMLPYLSDLPTEELWIILLNRTLQVIRINRLSTGGICATLADVRIMMKLAIKYNATSFILCHNHPSGNGRPSLDDDRVTEQAKKAGDFFDIHLQDHVIVTEGDNYYSYADEGKI